MKTFHTMMNVGSSKYVVNFHDGIKTHKDGSQFFDIFLTNNKKKRDSFIDDLREQGYTERQFFFQSDTSLGHVNNEKSN